MKDGQLLLPEIGILRLILRGTLLELFNACVHVPFLPLGKASAELLAGKLPDVAHEVMRRGTPEVPRRILPAERAVMLRRVARSVRAAMEVVKPAIVIRVNRGRGEEEVMASQTRLVRMMQW